MIIGVCRVCLTAEWSASLKEKRTVVKGITEKVKNRFNVSIAEIEKQDMHKEIVIGFACVSNESRHAQSTVQRVLNFIESHTEAVVTDVETEII